MWRKSLLPTGPFQVERCPSDHFPAIVFSTYPKYCYNFLGVKVTSIEGTQPIPSNTHQVRMEFKYDDGGLAKGGTVSLYWLRVSLTARIRL